MAGNRNGGLKAAEQNKLRDPNFYRNIGSKGGKNTCGGMKGFALNHDRAVEAGRKGGKNGKRGKAKKSIKAIA